MISKLQIYNYRLVRQFSTTLCYQKKNYYDSLRITPKATQGDIKTAYYKLSKECHPDLHKDDQELAEKFRDITAAYEVLSNVKNRKLYDRSLLVGTSVEFDTSPDPVNYDIQHESFHKQRNKPTYQKTSRGSPHYNMDEWTRAHYSETFTNAYQSKKYGKEYIRNEIKENEDFSKHGVLLSVLIALVSTGFMLVYVSQGSDRSVLTEKPHKPD